MSTLPEVERLPSFFLRPDVVRNVVRLLEGHLRRRNLPGKGTTQRAVSRFAGPLQTRKKGRTDASLISIVTPKDHQPAGVCGGEINTRVYTGVDMKTEKQIKTRIHAFVSRRDHITPVRLVGRQEARWMLRRRQGAHTNRQTFIHDTGRNKQGVLPSRVSRSCCVMSVFRKTSGGPAGTGAGSLKIKTRTLRPR